MQDTEIVVGVSGGIAAYKSAIVVSHLVQRGFGVRVVMTAAAKEFVGEATFAALSGRPVVTELFDRSYPLGAHIELARTSDILCVAPATANFVAKAALGLADDLLSSLYLCFQGAVIAAPAMNCEMWDKPAVQRNIKRLAEDGVQIIDPVEGWLSCRVKGMGRMADPEQIIEAIVALTGRTQLPEEHDAP
ncbi:MAG TPA: flavoprotein [Pirellulaceae bacterium]|nr:flavoprotein [Pirellulaceae bacterium]